MSRRGREGLGWADLSLASAQGLSKGRPHCAHLWWQTSGLKASLGAGHLSPTNALSTPLALETSSPVARPVQSPPQPWLVRDMCPQAH